MVISRVQVASVLCCYKGLLGNPADSHYHELCDMYSTVCNKWQLDMVGLTR